MKNRKNILSAILYLFTVPVFVIIILIDKPDYYFFNFLYRNLVPVAENIGQAVTYPIRLIGKAGDNIKNARILQKENDVIKEKLQNYEKLIAENEILQKENVRLLDKLKLPKVKNSETAFGKIIHNNSFFGSQNFIIESENNRIFPGNIVISNSGYLLGIITEKAGSISKIMSVKDTKSNIPVRIAGTDVFGFLQGDGGNNPKIRFLSDSDFKIEPDMFLITTGVKGNVPNNIPVGKIGSVKDNVITAHLGSDLEKQESAVILLFDRNSIYE